MSPHDLYCRLQPLRSMSPSAVVAEAVRRGLLVSSSSMEEQSFEEHSNTLIRAVEEHRRRECELQFENWQREEEEEKARDAPGTPPPSATASDVSSWDQNIVPRLVGKRTIFLIIDYRLMNERFRVDRSKILSRCGFVLFSQDDAKTELSQGNPCSEMER